MADLPLVSICCETYNHEKYIRDAIDGFLMQKTDFAYEIIIHDDASTDQTADIIRSYADNNPNIIPILQAENQHSKGVRILSTFVYPIVRGKYIALCEGDDYWTDPGKLQKQIDYMEEHPECTLCVHASSDISEI
jgi:glycosyltransferase involved in cell wall biosynthesis